MNKPIPFSVAMCVYGGDNAEHFRLAVESVLNQSVAPNEIVIVVDGQIPKNLQDIVSDYEKNPVFKIVRLKENMGHGISRRESLKNCSYDIVALMDADDICVYERFEKQLEYFENDDKLSIVGGNIAEFINTVDNIVGYRNVPAEDKDIKEYIKTRCPMNQVTVMFKKDDVDLVGGYIDWYCEEDYYLWLRMYLKGMRFANIPEVLVNVRVGEEMYQRRGGMKYFKSEHKLQKFMLSNKIISMPTYIINVCKRLIVQVLLPNKLRGWVFRKLARTQ